MLIDKTKGRTDMRNETIKLMAEYIRRAVADINEQNDNMHKYPEYVVYTGESKQRVYELMSLADYALLYNITTNKLLAVTERTTAFNEMSEDTEVFYNADREHEADDLEGVAKEFYTKFEEGTAV